MSVVGDQIIRIAGNCTIDKFVVTRVLCYQVPKIVDRNLIPRT